MRYLMAASTLLLVLGATGFMGASQVSDASTGSGAVRLVSLENLSSGQLPRLEVLSSDSRAVRLSFELPALVRDTVQVDGRSYETLSIPDGALIGEVGQPTLPTYSRLIEIPARAAVSVTSIAGDEIVVEGIDLLPMQDDSAGRFVLDAASYARDDYGAAAFAAVSAPGLCRGLRVVSLKLQPVRYNPARRTARVASRIEVEVRFDGEDLRNAAPSKPRPIARSFERLYGSLVVNYSGPPEGIQAESGSWLVICPNDLNIVSRLQPLLEWRRRKGLRVHLATTAETGDQRAQILAYIRAAYELWGDPPEFVVLAGDAEGAYQLPTWFETYSGAAGEGDNPYALLNGDDPIPDVHVGRLSFGTYPELETIVAKIVGYESTPVTSDPNWFTRACLVGDPYASGYSTVQVMQWVKTRLRQIGYAQIDTVFDSPFVSRMQTALNQGDTIFSYRGTYGMSGWTNTNTSQLTNGWKMPFAVISTCGTGSFAHGTSPSEAFLRVGTSTNPKAAVGAIGTATTGTHTRYNNCLTFGVFQGLLYEDQFQMGAALTRGKIELYRNYWDTPQSNAVWIFSHWNNLMGDPAAECWTAVPQPLTVEHPTNLPVGTSSVTVTVADAQGPVAGASVCLWKTNLSGGDVWAVGTTDDQGSCRTAVSLSSSGNLLLTVTGHNLRPYLYTIPVATAPRQVGYQSTAIDDDLSGESHGNADGSINPAESIELRIQARNFGSQAISGVTGHLSTQDPFVSITDADESFGDMPAGAMVWCQDDFGFTVDPACPHDHEIRFDLLLQSGSEQWQAVIPLSVLSADLVARQTTVYDGGNGLLDPGESANLSLGLLNLGDESADAVVGTLRSLSPWVTVADSVGTFTRIDPGHQVAGLLDMYRVHADPAAYNGHRAEFRLSTVFNGGLTDTTFFSLIIGQRSSTDPIGPDRHGYMAFDEGDLSYPDHPTYDWIEIDPTYGGDGTEIVLGDHGDYQDKSSTVPLPFDFQYYGENYGQVTVCSNGWLAMGQTYLTDYRNWNIPGAGAPNNILAVFWDDLYQAGDSKVLQKYDAANHRWIVEWSRMRNVGGVLETFEAVLHDPNYYPTGSRDGIILFQYQTVQNVDPIDEQSTIGIQNFDHTDGLAYTYFDQYPPGAAVLHAGLAIRFTPLEAAPRGTIQGTVRSAYPQGGPLTGAEVTLAETGEVFTTGTDGHYAGGASAGSYTVIARRDGFEPDTASGVTLTPLQVTTQDFELRDVAGPVIGNVSAVDHTPDTAGPYPVEATITDVSAVSSARLFSRANSGSWQDVPMTPAGDVYAASLAGRPAGTKVSYYISALDALGNPSVSPPGAPDSAYALVITSVTYAYNVEAPGSPDWTLGLPQDDARSGFWLREDPLGTEYGGQPMNPEDDHTPAPGVRCFDTGRVIIGGQNPEGDIDGGCTTLQSPVFDFSHVDHAWISYWRWYALAGVLDDQFTAIVSSNGGTNWRTLEMLDENLNSWNRTEFDLSRYITLTNQVIFRFVACDLNQDSQVEAALDDFSIETFVEPTTDVIEGSPSVSGSAPAGFAPWARPNPFSAGAALGFYLEKPGSVRVTIHDVQGRVVRKLLDGTLPAGPGVVHWDGRGEGGTEVSSGIYFYRLEAGGKVEERKVVRVE